ncbi:MAG: response regulator transcription factor [Chloroflexota bacterium]|nr:response regulator transcription factor [Chloroflexota bacterium]
MTVQPIRVLVVEDHPIVIGGIRALLAEVEDIEVIGEASNGAMAIEVNQQLNPDVILMDLIMPEMDGIEAIRLITADQPNAKILVLTSFITDDKVFPAIKAGALGYLLKESKPDDLIKAIRDVNRGEPSLHPNIAWKVLKEFGRKDVEKPIPDPLTDREYEVLLLVSKGHDNRDIAEKLFIAEVTVRTHVSRILRKLHLANRVQVTLYALKEGLTSLDEE